VLAESLVDVWFKGIIDNSFSNETHVIQTTINALTSVIAKLFAHFGADFLFPVWMNRDLAGERGMIRLNPF